MLSAEISRPNWKICSQVDSHGCRHILPGHCPESLVLASWTSPQASSKHGSWPLPGQAREQKGTSKAEAKVFPVPLTLETTYQHLHYIVLIRSEVSKFIIHNSNNGDYTRTWMAGGFLRANLESAHHNPEKEISMMKLKQLCCQDIWYFPCVTLISLQFLISHQIISMSHLQ